MPFINFQNPLTIIIGLILFILVLYLSWETKKSWIVGCLLFIFLGLLVTHAVGFITHAQESQAIYKAIMTSTMFDLIFIFLTFISYLWIDDIEAKNGKKKSIDNSLDWFWNKV